jgi:hypothetical protein
VQKKRCEVEDWFQTNSPRRCLGKFVCQLVRMQEVCKLLRGQIIQGCDLILSKRTARPQYGITEIHREDAAMRQITFSLG